MKLILTAACSLFTLSLGVAGYSVPPDFANHPQVDVVSWKTFSNEKYGIEFKYPAIWWLEESKNNGEFVIRTASKAEMYAFIVRVGMRKPASFIFESGLTQQVQIDGANYTAYLFTKDRCPEGAGECPAFYIPVQVKDKWYLLEGRRGIEGNKIAPESIYPALLQTVRFTSAGH